MHTKDRLHELFIEHLDKNLGKGELLQLPELRNYVISETVAYYLYELFLIAHVPYPAMDDIETLLREEVDELYLKAVYGLTSTEELAFRRGVSFKKTV